MQCSYPIIMGIRLLNRYINEYASCAIQSQPLSAFNGRKIAVDMSIYLYGYSRNNKLIENIFEMMNVFKKAGVIPIFIFDGKPPEEKMRVIETRHTIRTKNIHRLNSLQKAPQTKRNIHNIKQLEQKCIIISKKSVATIKQIIECSGMNYIEANGEADLLCAELVHSGRAWACMSDDMDMFVYGIPRVLRSFQLHDATAMLYDTEIMLNSLNTTYEEFVQICVVTGSDYNPSDKFRNNIYATMEYFKEYKKVSETGSKTGSVAGSEMASVAGSVVSEVEANGVSKADFIYWLAENHPRYITNCDLLVKITNKFMQKPLCNDNLDIKPNDINEEELHKIASQYGITL